MTEASHVPIARLHTGVPGLDDILGGGLPEYSFVVITGAPGTGKTTLAHQIAFALASTVRPALYFTVLGEPPLKMLRYMQQFSFFDTAKVGATVRFADLSQELLERSLDDVLGMMVAEIEKAEPGIVVVDSFAALMRASEGTPGALTVSGFLHRLSVHLTSSRSTTFLLGEVGEGADPGNPVFAVADGVLQLEQTAERSSIVRRMQVSKMRGMGPMPGLHTFRIDGEGVRIFPRLRAPIGGTVSARMERSRVPTGVGGLDAMMGGGPLSGDSVLVAGPAGTGKTALATSFAATGARTGQPAVIAVFEEQRVAYLARARSFGFDLESLIERGTLRVIYTRPLDLSVDETLLAIEAAVKEIGAKRVIIDSLSGFEIALAPAFREDFRESLYRMVSALIGADITVMMTVEITESFADMRFSPHSVSFLTDDIVLLRYVELKGQLRRFLTVVKMRSSDHSHDFREYTITGEGMAMGDTLQNYQGMITGVARLMRSSRPVYPGLTTQEESVLRALVALGETGVGPLATKAGLDRSEATRILERLVELAYALKETKNGRTVYRAVGGALK